MYKNYFTLTMVFILYSSQVWALALESFFLTANQALSPMVISRNHMQTIEGEEEVFFFVFYSILEA